MPVTGNNPKEVPECWFQNPMYRIPGNCRKNFLFLSYGRTGIQPCHGYAQACLWGPVEAGKVWVQHLGNVEAQWERVFSRWHVHNEKESLVDDMFSCLQSSQNNVCEAEFWAKLNKSSFSEIMELFERYMNFFRCENGRHGDIPWSSQHSAGYDQSIKRGWLGASRVFNKKLYPLLLCVW